MWGAVGGSSAAVWTAGQEGGCLHPLLGFVIRRPVLHGRLPCRLNPVAAHHFPLHTPLHTTRQVLQDAGRRAAYDRQLALSAAAADVHVDETVALGDLQPEAVDGQACWAWPCRCGGCYLLLAEDAEALVPPQGAAAEDVAAEAAASELIVPCSTCSLHIRVLAEQLRPAQ